MKTVRLTLKNYRGFSDQNPVTYEIGTGITAFLGPNNAGKSSAKLFFYELRGLFELLTRPTGHNPNLFGGTSGQLLGISGYPGTSDPLEIFNNTNERDLSFELEVLGATSLPHVNHVVNKIVATCGRSNPMHWKLRAFSVESPTSVLVTNGLNPLQQPYRFASANPNAVYDFADMIDALEALREARYYGAFRNAINQGSASHYDFQIGTGFIDLWNNWKTAGNKAQARAIGKITEEIRRLFEFEQLEINASTSLKTLLISVNGQPYRLGELGSGISQFIMALGNAATTKPSLILIDEPETNLHPALQIDFLLTLVQYARVGCVFSTHSVGLARSVADRIFSVQKGAQGPIVREIDATPNYTEFLGELSFSSFKEMGCDRIVLVEGVNDVKVVQQLLRLLGKEHTTVILPLGGDQMVAGNRELELQELKRLSNNISAVVDSERPSAGAPAASRRLKFEEVCQRLGYRVCLTERRALENYFPDRAVKEAFGPSFRELTPFDRLSDHPNGWSKSDNWRIARHITKQELLTHDVGLFLEGI